MMHMTLTDRAQDIEILTEWLMCAVGLCRQSGVFMV